MRQKITFIFVMLLLAVFTFAQEPGEAKTELLKQKIEHEREIIQDKLPDEFQSPAIKFTKNPGIKTPFDKENHTFDLLKRKVRSVNADSPKAYGINKPESQTKSASEQLDSVVWEIWELSVSEWNDTLKRIGTIDPLENKQSYIEYKYDEASGEWINKMQYERFYNASGSAILSRYSDWDEGTSQFISTWKYEYDYDEDGNFILWSDYYWDNSLNQWIGNEKDEYAYDEYGNEILEANYIGWDSNTNQWIGDSKNEFAYDVYGNRTLEAYYYWNETSGGWVGDYKYEYEYNSNQQITRELISYWWPDIGDWDQSYLYEYNYDVDGILLNLIVKYTPDWGSTAWVSHSKTEYSYDINGNNTQSIEYLYNDNTGAYDMLYFKEELTYDSNGNNISKIKYRWDANTQDWVGYFKYEYAYDANNNITLDADYEWDETLTNWVGNYKYEYAWDANSNMTLWSLYSWDETLTNWVGINKFEYAYDANSNMTLWSSYSWDENLTKWVGIDKSEYAFDANSNVTLKSSYSWDETSVDWLASSKSEYGYDTNGNPILEIYSSWDETSSQFISTRKWEYTYDLTKKESDVIGRSYNWSVPDYVNSIVNKPLGMNGYNWDNTSSEWVNHEQFTYYYSAATSTFTAGGISCEEAKEAVVGTNKAIFEADEWGQVENEQWFSFTPATDVLITVSSCDLTDADTYVEIISDCGDDYERFAHNDDACGAQSKASFVADEGETYYIVWSAWESNGGTVPWTLTTRELYKGETEDNPLTALPGTNFSNHWEGGSEAYFVYTPTENGYVEITSCGLTDVDTYVEVYDINDGTIYAADNGNYCNGGQSKVYIEVTAGQDYYILWQEFYIESGTSYPWELTFTSTPPEPGISCANPIPAVEGINTTVFGKYLVFYEYTASITGKLMLYPETAGSDAEFYLDNDCNYWENVLDTYQDGDTTYYWATQGEKFNIIALYDDFIPSSSVNVDWTLEMRDEEKVVVPGMTCTDAIDVTEGIYTTDNSDGDMWYEYTASEDGYLRVSSCGFTNEDTFLDIYQGCYENEWEYSDDYCDWQSAVSFPVVSGQTYLICWRDYNTRSAFDWEIMFMTGTELISFEVEYQASKPVIDETNHTVTVDVSPDAILSNLEQYFEVMDGSTVEISGTEISNGQRINFSSPVTYTVIGPDGTTQQDWVITVNQNITYLSENDILSFDSEYSTGPGVISGTTIDIELEYGTVSLSHCPDVYFELSPLASLEFNSYELWSENYVCGFSLGANTLIVTAEDGTSKIWTLNITETPQPPGYDCEQATTAVIGENTGVGVALKYQSQWFKYTPSMSGQLIIELLNDDSWTNLYAGCDGERQDEYSRPGDPANFIVEAQTTYYFYFESRNDEYIFNLSEAAPSSENDIEWFGFNNVDFDYSSRIIDAANHTVNITVPYGTNVTSLETEFDLSDGATAFINGIEQDNYGEFINFYSSVTYLIVAMDGSSQEWVVTVNVEDPETGNSINYFSFAEALSAASINDVDKTVTAWVNVDADLTGIIPFFSLSKQATMVLNGSQVISGNTVMDLTNPVTVSVKAEDGSSENWSIEVKSTDATSGTDIISFALPLLETIVIDDVNHTINISLAPDADVNGIIAVFDLSPNATATVGGAAQTSGVTAQDFSSSVTYTIKAQDGSTQDWTVTVEMQDAVMVTAINVSSESGSTSISTPEGTLQMAAEVIPEEATDNSITWSITNETGAATITSGGILTAKANGTVLAVATANDGSGVTGELQITITGQSEDVTLVSSITVSAEGGDPSISDPEGTLQLTAEVLPSGATDKSVTWSIVYETGTAKIASNGLVTAQTDGTVLAVATANDGSQVTGELQITITGQGNAIEDLEMPVFTIYPNPSENMFYIDAEYSRIENYNYSIYDISGKCVLMKDNVNTAQKEYVEIQSFAKGVYFLKINCNTEAIVKKVIKK